MHKDAITAKVAAVNRAQDELKTLVPAVLSAITPFIGQKVELASGGLAKKFDAALEPFRRNDRDIRVWFDRSRYSMHIRVSINEHHHSRTGGGFSTQRAEVIGYVAKLDGAGNLEGLHTFSPDDYRSDYTAAEVQECRAALKNAKDAVSAINSKLAHFGEWEQNA